MVYCQQYKYKSTEQALFTVNMKSNRIVDNGDMTYKDMYWSPNHFLKKYITPFYINNINKFKAQWSIHK